MPSPNKSLAVFTASNKKPPSKINARSAWTDYKLALVYVANLSDALENISSYVKACWIRENALRCETVKRKQGDISKRFKSSTKTLEKLEAKVANTDPYIQNADTQGSNSKDGSPKWSLKDIVLVSVTLLGAIVAVALGAANVYANLMAAGLPIFLESPWLAVTLSMIIPIGSLSIKFMTGLFEYDRTRRWFALFVYSATLLLVFNWSYLFAQSFANITGGLDIDTLLSGGSNNNSMLVWTQLLIELMAGSSLFIAADSISLKYNPRIFCDNPQYIDAKKALDAHKPEHIALRDELAILDGELAAMDADREATVAQHIADFIAYRERVNAANNLNY